ncbi:MAG: HAD-IB family hydrolase, partial [Anaerolineae bacterium]
MKLAACFDVDGTLTNENVWRGLMRYFQVHALRRGTHAAFLALHYPLYLGKRMGLVGESFFRRNWAAHLAWYLRGYTPQQAEAVWNWVVEEFLPPFWRDDVRARLEEHLQQGHVVALVSAGPQPLLERIARFLGAHYAAGTRFSLRNGVFDGGILPPVSLDGNKVQRIRHTLQEAGVQVDWQASWAYADSETDIPLLESVGNPVAVYPDAVLGEIARMRG